MYTNWFDMIRSCKWDYRIFTHRSSYSSVPIPYDLVSIRLREHLLLGKQRKKKKNNRIDWIKWQNYFSSCTFLFGSFKRTMIFMRAFQMKCCLFYTRHNKLKHGHFVFFIKSTVIVLLSSFSFFFFFISCCCCFFLLFLMCWNPVCCEIRARIAF